jgi:hypothetical protein
MVPGPRWLSNCATEREAYKRDFQPTKQLLMHFEDKARIGTGVAYRRLATRRHARYESYGVTRMRAAVALKIGSLS